MTKESGAAQFTEGHVMAKAQSRNEHICEPLHTVTHDEAERDIQASNMNLMLIERDRKITLLKSEVERYTKANQQLNQAVVERDAQIRNLIRSERLLRKSLSWRLTMPLRMMGRLVRGEFRTIADLFKNRFATGPGRHVFTSSRAVTALKMLVSGRPDLVLKNVRRVLKNEFTESVPVTELGEMVILATWHTHYVAQLIKKALADAGYSATVSFEFSPASDIGQLHFVICPQMFKTLPRNFVAFQMEQTTSTRWLTPEYFSILDRALLVFDYSVRNIEYFLEKGIRYQKLYYMPIGAFAGYSDYLSTIGCNLNKAAKPIDVLFYGDPKCERRRLYLKRLQSEFNVHVASEVYGEDLFSLVRQAKIVINIHYYENALLETTRLYETLSLGVPIVSESSIDIEYHKDLFDVISFTPIGDVDAMAKEIGKLLTNDAEYANRRKSIEEFVENDKKFSTYFKRYLLAHDLLDFSSYLRSVDMLPSSDKGMLKLCLSLTETTERKKSFLSKPHYGFEVVEGVRHKKGWIGCGMSYKYMLSKAKENGADWTIICEDDVAFPEKFDEKLTQTISYLQQSSRPWHLFAGLIAHLHPETKILAVEEYEGIQYVFINKMTSMVMNVYSPDFAELISHWNEKDDDPHTNTIDRYIESHSDLVVVTTLPFMVGHTEDQNSTLWGFNNTQYSKMIEESERLLAEKVSNFKLGNLPGAAAVQHSDRFVQQ